MRRWWGLACFNGLSAEQQERLLKVGVLPFGYEPEGGPLACQNGAQVAIETEEDTTPGPRFYCWPCALRYLEGSQP